MFLLYTEIQLAKKAIFVIILISGLLFCLKFLYSWNLKIRDFPCGYMKEICHFFLKFKKFQFRFLHTNICIESQKLFSSYTDVKCNIRTLLKNLFAQNKNNRLRLVMKNNSRSPRGTKLLFAPVSLLFQFFFPVSYLEIPVTKVK